jgi:hypothetical protein
MGKTPIGLSPPSVNNRFNLPCNLLTAREVEKMSKASVPKLSVVERKIAKLLAQLPPEFLLLVAETIDQREHWFNLREFYEVLYECWQAMHSGKNDPLVPLLKLGKISKTHYDYIWLTVDCYERLWELVQISFRYVRPELERLEMSEVPKSAYELFELILSDFATEQFEVCLEGYVKLPGRKLPELQTVGIKIFKGEDLCPYQEKRLQTLLAKDWEKKALAVNPAFVVTLATCHRKATGKQSILKARLDAYHAAMFNLLEQQKRLHWHTDSYAWSKGKLTNVN